MTEQDSKKKSNLRLAFILGTVAVLLTMWPFYLLQKSLGA